MHLKNVNSHDLSRKTSLLFGLLLLMAAPVSQAFAQQSRLPITVDDSVMADLMKLQGKVLSEGRNSQPIGPLKLTKYRVEELSLPHSIKVEIGTTKVEVDRAWRITIIGGPFQVRALPPVLWIDDLIVGYGAENEQLSEISVITFDRAMLREGAVISISYGESKDARIELPEKLTLMGTR